MPVLSVVIPRLKTNQLKWSFTGAFEVPTWKVCFFLLESIQFVLFICTSFKIQRQRSKAYILGSS